MIEIVPFSSLEDALKYNRLIIFIERRKYHLLHTNE